MAYTHQVIPKLIPTITSGLHGSVPNCDIPPVSVEGWEAPAVLLCRDSRGNEAIPMSSTGWGALQGLQEGRSRRQSWRETGTTCGSPTALDLGDEAELPLIIDSDSSMNRFKVLKSRRSSDLRLTCGHLLRVACVIRLGVFPFLQHFFEVPLAIDMFAKASPTCKVDL